MKWERQNQLPDADEGHHGLPRSEDGPRRRPQNAPGFGSRRDHGSGRHIEALLIKPILANASKPTNQSFATDFNHQGRRQAFDGTRLCGCAATQPH